MRNPCEKCPKRHQCKEICEKLALLLPNINEGRDKREISVDPARLEKFGESIEIVGLDPDRLTENWLKGRDV